MTISGKFWVAAALALVLASCGGGDSNRHIKGELMRPTALDAAQHRAEGVPSNFGDTRPHGWAGRVPAHYQVHGIDAARYQGVIDFASARRAGISFAWLKGTEGGDRVDPAFARNLAGARQAGVPVGAYHFYYFCRPAAEQARWFIRNYPRRKGDLPPVLDIEWNHTSPSCKLRPEAAKVRSEMHIFLDALTAHYGTRPVIYTTVDFWRDNQLGKLGQYDFWLRSVAAHPVVTYPGARWAFWQYTGSGVVPGVGGEVDINAFNGSPQGWQAWLKARQQ